MAVEKSEAFDEAFAERKKSPSKAGDSFYFNLGKEVYMSWVLTHQHPDDPNLWYLVPEDGINTFHVGSTDVEVPDTDLCGPTVIRTGRGLWAKMDSIQAKGERISFISNEYVFRVRQVLANLSRSLPLDITPKQEECDFDPDYEDYIDEISVLCTALDKMLNG